jgi:integrase
MGRSLYVQGEVELRDGPGLREALRPLNELAGRFSQARVELESPEEDGELLLEVELNDPDGADRLGDVAEALQALAPFAIEAADFAVEVAEMEADAIEVRGIAVESTRAREPQPAPNRAPAARKPEPAPPPDLSEVTVEELLRYWKANRPRGREAILDHLHAVGPHITALFLVTGLKTGRILAARGEDNTIVNGLTDRFIRDRDGN